MVASSSRAVITMIGTALAARIIGIMVSPSTSGSPRSSITTSGRSLITTSSPDSPPAATATACPRSVIARCTAERIAGSSSMTRMLLMVRT